MPEFPKAVFVSYASEDAEPARHLSEALQAVGLEVWFDKDELRGGDAWDQSIRKQIRECALFVPIVSPSTNSRAEGYFRFEWKLAVDRTHQMADDQPFLLPVALDGAAEATARVPDRFREVQWSRPFGPESPKLFAERALRLIGGGSTSHATVERRVDPARGETTPSIVVLPFVNLSRDEENEYFADGLSEELLNVLAKIRGLRVASRTSAFYFKGKTVDLATVARKLNVATVLEGSVRRAGNRVRVTAQLIDVANDSHLWSQNYDRELEDIFGIQDDIAQAVVTELRSALFGHKVRDEIAAAAADRTENPEAYRLYLEGRYFAERLNSTDTARAAKLFRDSLALDPEFALCWAALARIQFVQADYSWRPLEEGFGLAREAAERALALAPGLAEAHAIRGMVLLAQDWDWMGALREYEQAMAHGPDNPHVLRAYGQHLSYLGRPEGLAVLRRAAQIDPLSPISWRAVAFRCLMKGLFDEAEEAVCKAIDLSPTSAITHSVLSMVYVFRGDYAKAIEIGEKEAFLAFRARALSMAHWSLGNAEESTRLIDEAIEKASAEAAYQIAECYAWRKENDLAFQWLERAYAQRDPGLRQTREDRLFENLHGDSRWEPFLRKLGFT